MSDQDRYDLAMAHLNKHPEELEDSILFADSYPGGPLFFNAARNPYSYLKVEKGWLGNPVQIREYPDHFVAETDWLTSAILKDDRLPKSAADCRLEHLPVIAQWQRKIDTVLKRTIRDKPVYVEEDTTNANPDADVDDVIDEDGGNGGPEDEDEGTDQAGTELSAEEAVPEGQGDQVEPDGPNTGNEGN